MVSNKELLMDLQKQLQNFAENPDEMYLHFKRCRSQLYSYSLRNVMIANSQLYSRKGYGVEMLASYKKWQKMGRQVQKGEKGLKILAPLYVSNDVDGSEDELVGFRQTTVFDYSQTEGKELFKSEDDIKENNKSISLEEVISKSYKPVKINLETEIKKGETDYKEIRISKKISDNEKICVIFHELAHNLLRHNERELDKHLKEMEAESVAYIVSQNFGIINNESLRYITNWNKEHLKTFNMDSANNIIRASNEIVDMMVKEEGD